MRMKYTSNALHKPCTQLVLSSASCLKSELYHPSPEKVNDLVNSYVEKLNDYVI